MLSIQTDPKAPYVTTLFSDMRETQIPHVVCVAKCRFVFCTTQQKWVLDQIPPDFQEIDCWETVCTRQVTDLVPEKKQAELLLWGKMRPMAQVLLQDGTGSRTLVKTGHLAPVPALYWQGDWCGRPKGKSAMKNFMVAPAYARLSQSWEKMQALRFHGMFSAPSVAADTVFQTNAFETKGILASMGAQSKITFSCDSVCVNTDEGHIDMVWRARFPWDLMGEHMGMLYLDICKK